MLKLLSRLHRHRQGVPLIAHLNLRLTPSDPYIDFAAHLDTALGSRGLGKVTSSTHAKDATGGLTLMLEIAEISRPVLDLVTDALDELCAPRGSTLRDGSGRVLRIFGRGQSLALMFEDHLNPLPGTASDDDLLIEIRHALGARGRFHGLLRQDMGTAMCFLVPCAEEAVDTLQAILADNPARASASVQRVA